MRSRKLTGPPTLGHFWEPPTLSSQELEDVWSLELWVFESGEQTCVLGASASSSSSAYGLDPCLEPCRAALELCLTEL